MLTNPFYKINFKIQRLFNTRVQQWRKKYSNINVTVYDAQPRTCEKDLIVGQI